MPAPGKGIMDAYYPKKKKEDMPPSKEIELGAADANANPHVKYDSSKKTTYKKGKK